MKGILSLCKLFTQSLQLWGIQELPTSSFRISCQEKYLPDAVLNTINSFTAQKGWVWSGKYSFVTGKGGFKDHWEIIMFTPSGSNWNLGVLDNGELESFFFLRDEDYGTQSARNCVALVEK
jgi:hypothetical protein